jgi:hypothetical protein
MISTIIKIILPPFTTAPPPWTAERGIMLFIHIFIFVKKQGLARSVCSRFIRPFYLQRNRRVNFSPYGISRL